MQSTTLKKIEKMLQTLQNNKTSNPETIFKMKCKIEELKQKLSKENSPSKIPIKSELGNPGNANNLQIKGKLRNTEQNRVEGNEKSLSSHQLSHIRGKITEKPKKSGKPNTRKDQTQINKFSLVDIEKLILGLQQDISTTMENRDKAYEQYFQTLQALTAESENLSLNLEKLNNKLQSLSSEEKNCIDTIQDIKNQLNFVLLETLQA